MNKAFIKTFDSSINISSGIVRFLGNKTINYYSKFTSGNTYIYNLNWDTDKYWQGNGKNPSLEIIIKKYYIQLTTFAFKQPIGSCYQTNFSIYGIGKDSKQYYIGNYESKKYNFCSTTSSIKNGCQDFGPVLIPVLNNKDVLYNKFIIESLKGSCSDTFEHIAFSGIEMFGSIYKSVVTCKSSPRNVIVNVMLLVLVISI